MVGTHILRSVPGGFDICWAYQKDTFPPHVKKKRIYTPREIRLSSIDTQRCPSFKAKALAWTLYSLRLFVFFLNIQLSLFILKTSLFNRRQS